MENPEDLISQNSDKSLDPFDGFESKQAAQALQTFFVTSFSTNLGFSTMADRKANLMLQLNSVLLSAVLIFYKNILEFHELSMVTLILFLFTTLTSLILAALASQPFVMVV